MKNGESEDSPLYTLCTYLSGPNPPGLLVRENVVLTSFSRGPRGNDGNGGARGTAPRFLVRWPAPGNSLSGVGQSVPGV